jgi:hypothetical protein
MSLLYRSIVSSVVVAIFATTSNGKPKEKIEYQVRLATESWENRDAALPQLASWLKGQIKGEGVDFIYLGMDSDASKLRKVTFFTPHSVSEWDDKRYNLRLRETIGEEIKKLTFKVNAAKKSDLDNVRFDKSETGLKAEEKIERDKYYQKTLRKWAYSSDFKSDRIPDKFSSLADVKLWYPKPFEGWSVDLNTKLHERTEYRWLGSYNAKIGGNEEELTLTLVYDSMDAARSGLSSPIKGEISWRLKYKEEPDVERKKVYDESDKLLNLIGKKWGESP